MSIDIVTTARRSHLRRNDGQPGEGGRSVAVYTACGREVTGWIGEHRGGDLAANMCGTCKITAAYRNAKREVWREQHHAEIAQAESYVRTRFYPPLPPTYGELAVEAVERVNCGDDSAIELPSDLPILPKGAWFDAGSGYHYVWPAALVDALRLTHLIDGGDDEL